ncbi:DNA-binding CsgD family transcriptional regulator/sugar-specific transcriptional regulator TrmB [Streptomyces sp. V4I23]|uniref:helix-turn-helix transcriptional regulator n=1 Tax=Streptomyces sp. V4I23 TaxID=3042282 RepID=UPI0027801E28|nr:LuxR C-terminal-related transcriptional regulator [Streptomyces sp. V4I23]MDQ1007382.1 DNA-binding CsgD family transcriptional regulator/sugar-specific transcriptional regulator TrmB [Streptomyces sp. V4I23]
MSKTEKARTRSADLAVSLYQELRARGASSYDKVVADLELDIDERERCRTELLNLGLIVPTNSKHDSRLDVESGAPPEAETDTVAVIDPEIALLRLLQREQQRLQAHLAEADRSYSTLESLAGRFLRPGTLTKGSEVEVEVLTDYRRIQQVLEDMSHVVQHEEALMHPGTLQREYPERVLERDRRQLDKGVRIRAIFNQRFASVPEQAAYFRRKAEQGAEIRMSPVVPMNMVIADHHFALIPLDPSNPTLGAILARGAALVRSYLALYEYCWHTATPYGEVVNSEQGGDGLTEQQRAALRMLASGMKDEKIARSMGVSLRTVSRMLSELMAELGASSRFEAGVRAARLGWLD